jgi:hypothetical protein
MNVRRTGANGRNRSGSGDERERVEQKDQKIRSMRIEPSRCFGALICCPSLFLIFLIFLSALF